MKIVIVIVAVAVIWGATAIHLERVQDGKNGDGITTRYWDCCKPACSWQDMRYPKRIPVASCAIDGETPVSPALISGCAEKGKAYMCSNQQPWAVNKTFAYGFAAGSFAGGADTNYCCACFELTFSGQLQGKKMVLQNTNTGADLTYNQFDIALPGGGVGIFGLGCHTQWNASLNGWGDRYGGVHSEEECSQLPEVLQPGCKFRFEFMENVSNPPVHFEQVTCPKELIAKTGCIY